MDCKTPLDDFGSSAVAPMLKHSMASSISLGQKTQTQLFAGVYEAASTLISRLPVVLAPTQILRSGKGYDRRHLRAAACS